MEALTETEKAYQQIRDRIITTKLKPGSVVREADLMTALSIGRTPVREALKQLQIENLVVVKPRRGIFVSDISVTDLLQIFEIRIELEALACRLATERISPSQLANLKKLAEGYTEIDSRDKHGLIDLDGKFHCATAEASQNKFLRRDIEHYYGLSTRIWYLVIDLTAPKDIDVQAHLDIINAIEAGEAEKAAARITKHIKDFHKTIKQYL